jgi:hypothetical protein
VRTFFQETKEERTARLQREEARDRAEYMRFAVAFQANPEFSKYEAASLAFDCWIASSEYFIKEYKEWNK